MKRGCILAKRLVVQSLFFGQDIEAKDAPGMSVSACMKVRKHFDKETVLVLIRVCVCVCK